MIYLGFITLTLFLFVTNPLLKLTAACLYLMISRLSQMRVKILPNIILFISILLINVLYPYGEVLYEIGLITITKDALLTGINRASLLMGLIYLSRNISLEKLSLPGEIGIIIKDVFYYFNRFTSGRRVGFKTFIEDIDYKLLHIDDDYSYSDIKHINKGTKIIPILFILTLIIFFVDISMNNF